MHIFLIIVIALLILVIVHQQTPINNSISNKQVGNEQPNSLLSKPPNYNTKIAYLGSGKLFLIDEDDETKEIHSQFIHTALINVLGPKSYMGGKREQVSVVPIPAGVLESLVWKEALIFK